VDRSWLESKESFPVVSYVNSVEGVLFGFKETSMPVAQINGVELHYEVSGNKDRPPVVFAHPLIWGADAFHELMADLSKHFYLVTLDIHGHGRSGYRDSMTLDEMAEDCHGLLKALNAGKVVWFGCGIGGMIGMRLALAHPDAIEALVLMATSARTDPSTMKASTLHLWKMFRDGHRQDIADSAMKLFFAPSTYQSRRELIAKHRKQFLDATDARGMFASALAAFNRSDISSEVHKIKAPTLVIAGREDLAATPAHADFIASQISGAELKIIDDAGQLAGIEKADEIARLVRDFLSRTATASPIQRE
jgi:3-oxoadipate enol-lactonase